MKSFRPLAAWAALVACLPVPAFAFTIEPVPLAPRLAVLVVMAALSIAAYCLLTLRWGGVAARTVAVLIVAGCLVFPALAFAADPAPITAGTLFGDVRGTIETLLSIVVAGICGLLAWTVKRYLGVSIDGRMRDALQSALQNGVHAGLDAAQGLADRSGFEVKGAILLTASGYVKRFAPEALKHFGLSDAGLADLLRAQLAKVMPAGVVLPTSSLLKPAT